MKECANMEIRLVIKKGNRRLRAHQLTTKETVIGRRQDCTLCIRSSEVSRRHCLLTLDNDSLTVEDLDSVNGTLLNGKRITGKEVVRAGDVLGIGPVYFVVEFGQSRKTPKPVDAPKVGRAAAKERDEPLPVGQLEGATSALIFAEDDDALDALPLPEDEDETEQADLENGEPLALADGETVAHEGDQREEEEWDIPAADDLRKFLSQLDDNSRRKRK
jgi:pSer/pThr/pTyr-binding forkhead associated (FHA) protein